MDNVGLVFSPGFFWAIVVIYFERVSLANVLHQFSRGLVVVAIGIGTEHYSH